MEFFGGLIIESGGESGIAPRSSALATVLVGSNRSFQTMGSNPQNKKDLPWLGSYAAGLCSKVAERVGFEPTVTSLPRSISSRVPSTGLSHLSVLGG